MERPLSSPHRVHNPDSLASPSGFSHAVTAAEGRTVYLAGQTAGQGEGLAIEGTMARQFDLALANLLAALAAAGGEPQHVVSLQIFVTDLPAYRQARSEIGAAYRKRAGRHYPAMALVAVDGLLDEGALVELMGVAVIPS